MNVWLVYLHLILITFSPTSEGFSCEGLPLCHSMYYWYCHIALKLQKQQELIDIFPNGKKIFSWFMSPKNYHRNDLSLCYDTSDPLFLPDWTYSLQWPKWIFLTFEGMSFTFLKSLHRKSAPSPSGLIFHRRYQTVVAEMSQLRNQVIPETVWV